MTGMAMTDIAIIGAAIIDAGPDAATAWAAPVCIGVMDWRFVEVTASAP